MFNFTVKQSKKTNPEDEQTVILQIIRTKRVTTQHHIPEDWNLQQQPLKKEFNPKETT